MELIDRVAEEIDKYLAGHKSRNLSTLSKKSGVSYATIRRVYQKDVYEPQIDRTIVPMLSVFLSQDEIHDIIAPYNKSYADLYMKKDVTNILAPDDFEPTDQDYTMMLYCHKEGGLSGEEAERRWGQVGLCRLDTLVEKKLLRKSEKSYHPPEETYRYSSPKYALKQIESAVRTFNLDNIGHGAFYNLLETRMDRSDYAELRRRFRSLVEFMEDINAKSCDNNEESLVARVSFFGDFISESGELQ